jgi:hypothetical protein
MGNSAGTYARMDESAPGTNGINLQDLKRNDVLKTTTTEVRSDRMEGVMEDIEILESGREKEARRAMSLSEVHILEYESGQACCPIGNCRRVIMVDIMDKLLSLYCLHLAAYTLIYCGRSNNVCLSYLYIELTNHRFPV